MQNYFDDKAQQEETSENGNRGDDLWRNEIGKKSTKPISNARSVTKPMKRVQEKRWTCLGAGTLEGA